MLVSCVFRNYQISGDFLVSIILGPLKCTYSMNTTQTKMTSATYQLNALDISYNGWNNYETWNVALWINNDESLYHLAQDCGDYETLVKCLYDEYGVTETKDGVKFNSPKVNVIQLNSDVFDF